MIVLARMDTNKKGQWTGEGYLTLFFPNVPANYGRIVCWTMQGGHGEATLEYYHSLSCMPKKDALLLIEKYKKCYPMEDEKLEYRQRLNMAIMRKAWER